MSNMGFNPWLSIWTSPRTTMRGIIERDVKHHFKILCFIYGLIVLLNTSRSALLGATYPLWAIVILSLILAFPVGYIGMNISSLLFFWIGKLFKGSGSFLQVRSAVAWSTVPSIISIVCWIVLIALFRASLFHGPVLIQDASTTAMYLLQIMLLVQFIMGVWGFIIFLHGLGEVQSFSAWISLLNVIIVMIVWVLILFGCVFVTYMLMRSNAVAVLMI